MINVFIADDHAMFRDGLKQILENDSDFSVVGEAQNGKEVFGKIYSTNVDVLILDISMPGRNGLDILKQLKDSELETKVLMVSMLPDEQYAVRAMKAGADGYLSKNMAARHLIMAIKRVASGKKYISQSVAEYLALAIDESGVQPPHKRLSNREFEILILIASGKSVTQIARELNLSNSTISTIRSRVLEKMNMKGNADLTRYAIKEGLTE